MRSHKNLFTFIAIVHSCIVCAKSSIILPKFDLSGETEGESGEWGHIYTKEIGEWSFTLNKKHYANWPDAFETCKKFGASLIHFDNKDDLEIIRKVIRDPALGDVGEFWSAGVVEKSVGRPGFSNIDLNHELNFFKFLRGDSRCVSFATQTISENSTTLDLNYGFCMRRKLFMCQEPRKVKVDETVVEREYFEKEINGWHYFMNLTEYATWKEAFEICKSRGGGLVTAAKYDQTSALLLVQDPQLRKAVRFWSAGVINPNGVNTWLGKSSSLIDDPALLHALIEGKLHCIYNRIPTVPKTLSSSYSSSLLSSSSQTPSSLTEVPLNYSLCSVKMLFMCEEPTYQILRTDSTEEDFEEK